MYFTYQVQIKGNNNNKKKPKEMATHSSIPA